MKRVVLASGSAIRAQLLENAGVKATAEPASVDEGAMIARLQDAGAPAPEIAEALAIAKASARLRPAGVVVIGADQVLSDGDVLLQKAPSLAAARARLQAFRGRSHRLICGAALVEAGATLWSARVETVVTLRGDLTDDAIDGYLAARGEALLASVACYEIEGGGAQLIERLEGDYFSALGLPLLPVLAALRDAGALLR